MENMSKSRKSSNTSKKSIFYTWKKNDLKRVPGIVKKKVSEVALQVSKYKFKVMQAGRIYKSQSDEDTNE